MRTLGMTCGTAGGQAGGCGQGWAERRFIQHSHQLASFALTAQHSITVRRSALHITEVQQWCPRPAHPSTIRLLTRKCTGPWGATSRNASASSSSYRTVAGICLAMILSKIVGAPVSAALHTTGGCTRCDREWVEELVGAGSGGGGGGGGGGGVGWCSPCCLGRCLDFTHCLNPCRIPDAPGAVCGSPEGGAQRARESSTAGEELAAGEDTQLLDHACTQDLQQASLRWCSG